MNRSAGSELEFQQNELQNGPEFVTLMNNKAAAISKRMELPGDSEFFTLQKQWSTSRVGLL